MRKSARQISNLGGIYGLRRGVRCRSDDRNSNHAGSAANLLPVAARNVGGKRRACAALSGRGSTSARGRSTQERSLLVEGRQILTTD